MSDIEQLRATIRDIETMTEGFVIVGQGVSGDIRQGFMVNPPLNQPAISSAAGRTGCFTAPNLRATFSGVVTGCGCIDLFGASVGAVTVNGINATFTVPFSTSGVGFTIYQTIVPSIITIEEHFVTGCADAASVNARDGILIIYCSDGTGTDPAGVHVRLRIETSPTIETAGFYCDTADKTASVLSNQLACGVLIVDPTILAEDAIGIASGGTITIEEIF